MPMRGQHGQDAWQRCRHKFLERQCKKWAKESCETHDFETVMNDVKPILAEAEARRMCSEAAREAQSSMVRRNVQLLSDLVGMWVSLFIGDKEYTAFVLFVDEDLEQAGLDFEFSEATAVAGDESRAHEQFGLVNLNQWLDASAKLDYEGPEKELRKQSDGWPLHLDLEASQWVSSLNDDYKREMEREANPDIENDNYITFYVDGDFRKVERPCGDKGAPKKKKRGKRGNTSAAQPQEASATACE